MNIPSYWMPRPTLPLDPGTQAQFERLYAAIPPYCGGLLDYSLPAPKWQFLCYLAEQHSLAVHGSGQADIAQFEPRQTMDLNPFGNQKAVYAAADGIWAMFFAILDRDHYPMSLHNGCIRVVQDGQTSGPLYVFSISKTALARNPWRTGYVYLLPRASFQAEPPFSLGPVEVHVAQLASLEPVTPLACLEVGPADFPFLASIRGHDDARFADYAHAMQTAGPWPDDPPA